MKDYCRPEISPLGCCICNLFSTSCIQKNVGLTKILLDEKLFRPLKLFFDVDFIPLIGNECFNLLCEQKETETLTEINAELIRIAENFASWGVYFYYLQSQILRIDNAKIVNTSKETENALRSEFANSLRYRDIYKAKFIHYLTNTAELPCKIEGECGCNDCSDNLGGYFDVFPPQ